MTPAGIEPATFRIVAQHLNHCATAVPYKNAGIKKWMHRSATFRFVAQHLNHCATAAPYKNVGIKKWMHRSESR